MHLRALYFSVILLLSGCTTSMDSAVRTVRTAFFPSQVAVTEPTNPRFTYLKVKSKGGGISYLALGYVDPSVSGPIEVWYSSQLEVLRLKNGRLVGLTGTNVELRSVNFPQELPGWDTLLKASERWFDWSRSRDLMPGYRYGLTENIRTTLTSIPDQLQIEGIDRAKLTWFREDVMSSSDAGLIIPPSLFGVDFSGKSPRVVYSEQCVAPDLCIAFQRWTVDPSKKSEVRN